MERRANRNQGSDKEEEMSQAKDQDEIAMLRSEIAYLKGKVSVYEKFLKDKGFIKEEE